jgi:hypothetical protein
MRIRLSPDLKNKIETESKANGRSMNAEISARLEDTFRSLDFDAGELPSADELRTTSQLALDNLRSSVWEFAVDEVLGSARVGKHVCPLDLSDVPGFEPEDEKHAALADELVERLEQKGYKTDHSEVEQIIVFWD